MTPLLWPCPQAHLGAGEEYALVCDRGRARRLLIVPALFDEANRLRRFTVEVMRRLDRAGVDTFLPDFPGTNESPRNLCDQDADSWRAAMTLAAEHFGATHVLALRGGRLFAPVGLPSWHYAPVKGASILRSMVRARVLASREAGREEAREILTEMAHREGVVLAGYSLGAALFGDLETREPDPSAAMIAQDQLGGSGLWLRAEPDEDAAQADALAALLIAGLGA
ncbi:hypothetical protein EDF56_1011010 [Novosphingobium sp. PhB165]|uniref:hypothetical protein n=1 Tax=Novosphingobium sp. PhB165 TaxID=2485105 RepID=UPI00104498EA|nr:hypothetical protein [Novosphingobium sp. PhB165]TCM22323.1 hypothetical protein EDF56_1011010 [Novosphingobium sp. PhB165]